jgi:tRNA-2-methylthio-N6-dimethylallyladenosine synthase
MNAADSEVIAAVLTSHGYEIIESKEKMISMTSPPEVILVNTCAIRDKAEERVKTRLRQFRSDTTKKSSFSTQQKKKKKAVIGVLGCMGERIKGDLLKKDSKGVRLADIVAGPDSYRDLPRLIENAISNNNSNNSIGKKEKKKKKEDDDNEEKNDDGNVFGDFPHAKRSSGRYEHVRVRNHTKRLR